jgi:tRNA-guanine family transglycosylase
MLLSYHNLYFLHHLILSAREAIRADRFAAFKESFLQTYFAGQRTDE